jgi:hypothetical protein
MRLLSSVALLLSLTACGARRCDRGSVVVPVDSGPPECHLALYRHCNGPCKSYAAVLAELRDPRSPGRAPYGRIVVGSCSGGHYVLRSVWYMTHVEYFNEAGEMIAATESADNAQYCDGHFFSARFGSVPSCPHVPTEVIVGTDGADASP